MEEEFYPWTAYLVTVNRCRSLNTRIIWEDSEGEVWGIPNPYGKTFVSEPIPQGATGLFFPMVDYLAHYLDVDWAYDEVTHTVIFTIKRHQDTTLIREILTAIWRHCFGGKR